jgi:hypothetical protein
MDLCFALSNQIGKVIHWIAPSVQNSLTNCLLYEYYTNICQSEARSHPL